MDQTQAVYAAEDLWEKKDWNASIRFGDWHEIQPFYVTLAKRLREEMDLEVYPPTVMPRNGALKAHYDPLRRAVFIPPYERGGVWALNTATAVHEFAHHLSPEPGHGPAFRDAMLDCLDALGWDSDLLEKCYADAGLAGSEKDESIRARTTKILAQADAPGRTEEEKQSFLEKAEALAAKHSLDLALLRKQQADADGHKDSPITGTLFPLTALPNTTYRNLAVELGTYIGRAHGCRCTIRGRSQYMTFYGFEEDIQLTELMFTRITPMMFESADEYLKSPAHKASGTATVSARITFCKNFTYEVYKRLKAAVDETQRKAVEQTAITDGQEAATSTEIAIRDKAVEVADYVAYAFKKEGVKGSWKGSNTNTWDSRASEAGSLAGQRANLYGRKELG